MRAVKIALIVLAILAGLAIPAALALGVEGFFVWVVFSPHTHPAVIVTQDPAALG